MQNTITYTINTNTQFNSLEIFFDGKPSDAVREALKALKFRWHKVKKCWYGYAEQEAVQNAIDGADAPLVIPEASEVDPGSLYQGWQGGNNRKWSSEQELKQFILADFKKAGIKATIKFGRGGYLTSFTCTIQFNESEIITEDEYAATAEDRSVVGFGWIDYIDQDGNRQTIHHDSLYGREDFYQIMDSAKRLHYRNRVSDARRGYTVHHIPDFLNESAKARFALAKKIVASYNRDCTNSMIDYFDRDIYDDYAIKFVK